MAELDLLQRRIRETFPSMKRSPAKRPRPVGFLRYFFKERGRIAAWNETARMIEFGFMGFQLGLSRDYRRRFSELVTRNVVPLTSRAERILAEGWRWSMLSIREYNVIVFFVDLCRKLVAVSDDQSFSEVRFYKMHEAVVRLTLRPDYEALLLAGLEKVLMSHSRSDPGAASRTKTRLDRLRRFFQPETPQSSIYNFILAFAMVGSRRYLDWSDMTNPTSADWLPATFYNCSTETLRAIVHYYRNLSAEIQNLRESLDWLTGLDKVSGVSEGRAPKPMVDYYEAMGYQWKVDMDDYFLLILNLAKRVRKDLDRILHQTFEVMNTEETIVEARVVEDVRLETLFVDFSEYLSAAEGRYQTLGAGGIAVPMYRAADKPRDLLPSKDHAIIFDKIARALSCLFQTGVILREMWEQNNAQDGYYLRHMIVKPEEMRGRPLLDVFAVYAELLLQICGYFKNSDLMAELKRIPKTEQLLEKREAELERLDAHGLVESVIMKKKNGAGNRGR